LLGISISALLTHGCPVTLQVTGDVRGKRIMIIRNGNRNKAKHVITARILPRQHMGLEIFLFLLSRTQF
jgi:hypothetical protein